MSKYALIWLHRCILHAQYNSNDDNNVDNGDETVGNEK